jgi:hypothetical protein
MASLQNCDLNSHAPCRGENRRIDEAQHRLAQSNDNRHGGAYQRVYRRNQWFYQLREVEIFSAQKQKNGAPGFIAGRPVHSRSRSMRQARIN